MNSLIPSTMKSSKIFSVNLSEEMDSYVRAICFRRKCSRSEYFRRLVEKDMKDCDTETRKFLSVLGVEIGPQ